MSIEINPSDIPLPKSDSGLSVEDVRESMRILLAAGESVRCSCCGGEAKVYSRGLHAQMVRALDAMARAGRPLSAHEIANAAKSRDYPTLQYFGLAERTEKEGWLITSRGRDFLMSRTSIPHKVLVFGGHVIGFDVSKRIFVSDVRHASVDLSDILASWGTPVAAE